MPTHNILPSFLIRVLLSCTVFVSIGSKPPAAFAKAPTAKTLLWEVSGKGLKQPSYLLGTMHLGCETRLALTPQQQKALGKSQQLYLEIDLTTPSKKISTTDSKIPGGKKLKDIMTAAQYQEVEDYFGNLERFGLSEVRPAALATKISYEFIPNAYNRICKQTTTKENVLIAAANQSKMFIGALENNTVRNNALDTTPIEDEVEELLGLLKLLNSSESPEKIIADNDKIYNSQDLVALCAKSSYEESEFKERHRVWLPRMIQAMSQKSTFFGFGAAHLCEDYGIISLLQAKGYNVRPIFDVKGNVKMTAEDYLKSGQDKEFKKEILDALDDYSQAITLNPRYVEAYYERGHLKKEKIRDPLGALADFEQIIAIDPKNYDAYYERGLIRSYSLNNYKGAADDFKRTISLNPEFLSPYYERGLLRGDKLNDPQGALSDFNYAISQYPNAIDYHLARGILKYNKLNDKSGGIADVRRAAKIARMQGGNDAPLLKEALIVLRVMGVPEKPTP
jgi:uncharacterized protein